MADFGFAFAAGFATCLALVVLTSFAIVLWLARLGEMVERAEDPR